MCPELWAQAQLGKLNRPKISVQAHDQVPSSILINNHIFIDVWVFSRFLGQLKIDMSWI